MGRMPMPHSRQIKRKKSPSWLFPRNIYFGKRLNGAAMSKEISNKYRTLKYTKRTKIGNETNTFAAVYIRNVMIWSLLVYSLSSAHLGGSDFAVKMNYSQRDGMTSFYWIGLLFVCLQKNGNGLSHSHSRHTDIFVCFGSNNGVGWLYGCVYACVLDVIILETTNRIVNDIKPKIKKTVKCCVVA